MLHVSKGLASLASGLFFLAGCAPAVAPAPPPSAAPVAANPVDSVEIKGPVELVFWHRQTGDSEALQQKLIDEFMAANANVKIKAESLGDYNKLYQKIIASIQAGSPPDVVAAYENQAAEYFDAAALVPFDDYIKSKKYGLTEAELADYVSSFIEATKFPQYGGKSLTFPYTKSDLVMYTNMEVVRALGFDKPAATWDEFLTHCRKAVTTGKQCYAMEVSASTFDGIVFSYGGDVVSSDGKRVLFDQPAVTKALQLYDTLAKEKLAYRVQGTDDQNDILAGRAVYMIRSSTSVPRLASGFKDNAKWEVTLIPQGTADKKATVLFGANISIMKSTPEKQLAAWLFIKYLTSRDVTARWGLDPSNGYFPVRQSALEQPSAKKFMDENPRFRQAFEIARYGKVEPSVRGWQEVRNLIEDSVTAIATGKATVEQTQKQLQEKATKAIQ
ncbi:MAG: ABC transporter substrate-binding protein [Chloroflexi bacterium]|nr:ABC transporter substrate-binding protein [Chloroflexota bacterium]